MDGLYYGYEPTEVVDATWTGAAGTGDITMPGNWTCLNAAGTTVADGLPTSKAAVYIKGSCAPQIPAGSSLPYATLDLDHVQLTADCDWRGFPGAFNGSHRLVRTNQASATDGTATELMYQIHQFGRLFAIYDVHGGAVVQRFGPNKSILVRTNLARWVGIYVRDLVRTNLARRVVTCRLESRFGPNKSCDVLLSVLIWWRV